MPDQICSKDPPLDAHVLTCVESSPVLNRVLNRVLNVLNAMLNVLNVVLTGVEWC